MKVRVSSFRPIRNEASGMFRSDFNIESFQREGTNSQYDLNLSLYFDTHLSAGTNSPWALHVMCSCKWLSARLRFPTTTFRLTKISRVLQSHRVCQSVRFVFRHRLWTCKDSYLVLIFNDDHVIHCAFSVIHASAENKSSNEQKLVYSFLTYNAITFVSVLYKVHLTGVLK